MKFVIFGWLAVVVGVAACGSEEEGGIDVEACELIETAAMTVTATTSRAAAPVIAAGETPYEVTGSATDKTYLRVEAAAAGHAVLFFKQANVASGKYYFGSEENNLPAGEANENCATVIPDHYHVEFSDPGTYAIELNPIAAKITLLLHPEEEEEEEGEHGH